ncbi:Chaperone protein DnaJ [Quillaja saponaria]|uniref:Chaperone protein DnaJ n=1 Tax=Quillaja saponaria TaxID=32244 RepID=A0AAD7LMW8_QUISA|nr:Chaperone protein DnaJ [Quillaja saponaria]
MEMHKEEALKAIEIAERRFALKDFAGAKDYALKAKTLYPGLEGISQMVATFEVYVASEVKFNGETDYYSILGLKPLADKDTVKKRYKKMAVMLHPDKNKCVGADGAFKLVSDAWTLLSDGAKRKSYDLKRNTRYPAGFNQTNLSSIHVTGVPGYNSSNLSTSHGRLDTFWTICTSCKVQYEYLRKYVNKRLSCKNCRGTFIAVETGTAPATGAFPYCPVSYVPGNGYGSHSFDGVTTYVPNGTTLFNGNGVSAYHSGLGYEYTSNVSFQWSSLSGTSTGVIGQNGTTISGDSIYQANGNVKSGRAKVKSGANRKHPVLETVLNVNSDVSSSYNVPQETKPNGPDKRRKIVLGVSSRNGFEEKGSQSGSEAKMANSNASIVHNQKLSSANELQTRQSFVAPAFDARKLLIEKARTEIWKKLEEMKLFSETTGASAKENAESRAEVGKLEGEAFKRADSNVSGHQLEPRKTGPVSIMVPDPDFHDFDKDRSEECFKPKQIWALYDEDGHGILMSLTKLTFFLMF